MHGSISLLYNEIISCFQKDSLRAPEDTDVTQVLKW